MPAATEATVQRTEAVVGGMLAKRDTAQQPEGQRALDVGLSRRRVCTVWPALFFCAVHTASLVVVAPANSPTPIAGSIAALR